VEPRQRALYLVQLRGFTPCLALLSSECCLGVLRGHSSPGDHARVAESRPDRGQPPPEPQGPAMVRSCLLNTPSQALQDHCVRPPPHVLVSLLGIVIVCVTSAARMMTETVRMRCQCDSFSSLSSTSMVSTLFLRYLSRPYPSFITIAHTGARALIRATVPCP
jgi:hypothetical protein